MTIKFLGFILTSSLFFGCSLFLISCGCGCKKANIPAGVSLTKQAFDGPHFVKGTSGHSYPIFSEGIGNKPILLLHELPGLNQGTLSLAKELGAAGYTVYSPQLFGTFGQNSIPFGLIQTGLSPRFSLTNPENPGLILDDLDSMISWVSERHKGQPLTVIGNCLTGGLPLAALENSAVKTAVLCQPAIPFKSSLCFGERRNNYKTSWAFPREDLSRVGPLLESNREKRILVFQYFRDNKSPHQRVEALTKLVPSASRRQLRVYSAIIDSDKEALDKARQQGWFPVIAQDKKGHSTVTGANSPDVKKFRKILFTELSNS